MHLKSVGVLSNRSYMRNEMHRIQSKDNDNKGSQRVNNSRL